MWLEIAVRGLCWGSSSITFWPYCFRQGCSLNLKLTNSTRLLVSKLLDLLVSYPALRSQRCAVVPTFLHRYWGSELSSRYLVGKNCTDWAFSPAIHSFIEGACKLHFKINFQLLKNIWTETKNSFQFICLSVLWLIPHSQNRRNCDKQDSEMMILEDFFSFWIIYFSGSGSTLLHLFP